ncbi:MAG: hypothetical protein NVS2B3_17490 [Vulcanimicrobiaceae bacterium]
MVESTKPTTTWPELAEGLYGFLTGRGATIEYTFENMEIWVPSSTHAESPAAKWKMNGTLRIRTSEGTGAKR